MVAAFHAAATRSPAVSDQGTRAAIEAGGGQPGQVGAAAGQRHPGSPTIRRDHRAGRFLTGRDPLFARRIATGRMVDGHGDLIADDIFCLADGPRILDCLDFDDRLRFVDGLDDICFLAMDLERLGSPELGRLLLRHYADLAGDPAPASLRHHFIAYRAFVRCKVSCLRNARGTRSRPEARRLAALALRHLHAGAVTLVLIGGLPGTGKSALAGALAGSGFHRAEQRPDPQGTHRHPTAERNLPSSLPVTGIYSPSWTERTYKELLTRARGTALAPGESVIADASWISADRRAAAEAATAEGAAAEMVQLHCTAPQALTARRIRTEKAPQTPTPRWRRKWQHQAPWTEATTIDTSGAVTASAGEPGQPANGARRDPAAPPRPVWRPARPYMLPD